METTTVSENTTTVEVYGPRQNVVEGERLYYYILDWFANNNSKQPYSVAQVKSNHNKLGKLEENIISLPGFSVPITLTYKGEIINLERHQVPYLHYKTFDQDVSYEKFVFTSEKRNRSLIYEFLEECKPKKKGETHRLEVYGITSYLEWDQIGGSKMPRPLSSVILAEDLKEKFMSDVKEFRESEEWYVERGISYRRGYLLYGPPGCGKTSIIKAIAGEFRYSIYVLSLTAKRMSDESLNMLLNDTPENSIVLLEDVDAAFRSREDKSSNPKKNLAFEGRASSSTVTFGGLLNALDGVASSEGRIICMTTNYIEKLDPALMRPGRVDMKLFIDYPSDAQLLAIFMRFYPNADEEDKQLFVEKVNSLEQRVSMAAIQGLFMLQKNDPKSALDSLEDYFREQIFVTAPSLDQDVDKSTEDETSLNDVDMSQLEEEYSDSDESI